MTNEHQPHPAPTPPSPTEGRGLRVAIIGAGPAGVYAADLLTKSEPVASGTLPVSIEVGS